MKVLLHCTNFFSRNVNMKAGTGWHLQGTPSYKLTHLGFISFTIIFNVFLLFSGQTLKKLIHEICMCNTTQMKKNCFAF